jgi:hypothetical protein
MLKFKFYMMVCIKYIIALAWLFLPFSVWLLAHLKALLARGVSCWMVLLCEGGVRGALAPDPEGWRF